MTGAERRDGRGAGGGRAGSRRQARGTADGDDPACALAWEGRMRARSKQRQRGRRWRRGRGGSGGTDKTLQRHALGGGAGGQQDGEGTPSNRVAVEGGVGGPARARAQAVRGSSASPPRLSPAEGLQERHEAGHDPPDRGLWGWWGGVGRAWNKGAQECAGGRVKWPLRPLGRGWVEAPRGGARTVRGEIWLRTRACTCNQMFFHLRAPWCWMHCGEASPVSNAAPGDSKCKGCIRPTEVVLQNPGYSRAYAVLYAVSRSRGVGSCPQHKCCVVSPVSKMEKQVHRIPRIS